MTDTCCPERETLLPAALGEPLAPDLAGHLQDCPDCRLGVDRLRRLLNTLRQTLPGEAAPAAEGEAPAAAQRPAALGKYLVVGELGGGGEARVFRAVDPGLGRDVAITPVAVNAPVAGS